MNLRVLTTFILLYMSASADCYKDLNLMASWKVLEYGFNSDADRQYAIDNGLLTNNTGTPIDVDVHYTRDGGLRIFTTIPRFTNGIPFTLATLSSELGPNGPIIYPYPSYEWHNKRNKCSGITSAFRVAIDDCGHMWVIDSGVVAGVQVCPPQLVVFDLRTDKLIHCYQFSEDVYDSVKSLLVTLVLDVCDPPPSGQCQHVMVYIADVKNYGLVVYDFKRNAAWRIENELMNGQPEWANQTIAGETFELIDGLFALSLTPRLFEEVDNERYLYFHALAAETEVKVSLRHINNQTIWLNNKRAIPEAFIEIGRRGIQSPMEAMDSRGNLFTNIHAPSVVFVWNIRNIEYSRRMFQVVANNPDQLQFASGMKVKRNPLGQEELWISTCRFQKIGAGTQNPAEINFRILACKTNDLLYGWRCEPLGIQTRRLLTSLYSNSIL